MRVESVVPDFLSFWREAAGRPREEQRRLWRERYEDTHRDLFDLYYTTWASPDMLDAALERFPAEIDRISAGADALPARVEDAARTVAAALDAPVPALDVVLLVGLFSSDGWVTEFRGRRTLFFAVEYLPQPPHDEVFFAHEATHVVHRAVNRGFDAETLAAAAFAEGLAVVVSEQIVPGRSDGSYLWMRDRREDWVDECEARWSELRERFAHDLDSGDADVYAKWFLGRPNDSGLPSRCGYFVARRLVRALGVAPRELVRWDYAQARAALG